MRVFSFVRSCAVFVFVFAVAGVGDISGIWGHGERGEFVREAFAGSAHEKPKTTNNISKIEVKEDAKNKDEYNTYKYLNLFGDVFERIKEDYVDEVSDKKLIESALNGMLSSLDPHSSYLNADDYEDMRVQTSGKFGGLGIEVTMENGFVKVVSPIDDTPAYRAGIQAGDYITHLDGEPIMGLTLGEAVDRMRGKPGTKITLTIRRKGVNDAIKVDIVRDIIKIKSVKYRVEDGNVGYIRITTFNQNTASGVENAVKEIKEKVGEGNILGYIIDLRNNPGGLLDQAIFVADAFLDRGEIVSTRGRDEKNNKRDNATPGDIANGAPIVVLINGGSASASEIVAGALQDHRRAIILGTKSFGKGSVQTVIPLQGRGAMRLTTARYYTPSGRSIQAKGIEPDIVVEQAKLEEIADNGIREGDLRGALDNGEKGKNKPDNKKSDKSGKSAKKEKDKNKGKDFVTGEAANDNEKESKPADYQLSRAIDLLRGVSMYNSRMSQQRKEM